MARHVFFSFHYKDVAEFRANVVRNSWLTIDPNNREVFYDKSLWESVKTKGATSIKNLIDEGLNYTSVTAVLIGSETHERRWVKYEILRSFEDGNGILGVHINRIRGSDGYIKSKGLNPFDRLGIEVSDNGRKLKFCELINGSWYYCDDLPEISNKKSNTVYFEEGWFGSGAWGKFFKFSDLFETYCWDIDNGYRNFPDWVEDAFNNRNKSEY